MTPWFSDDWYTILVGDAREVLTQMEPESVHCVVTSPPYWGLRDYGTATWVGGDEGCDHALPRRRTYGPADAKEAVVPSVRPGDPGNLDCGRCGAHRVDVQLGLEPTPDAYIEAMTGVFREVRRVLRKDGTLWLNIGDSYASHDPGGHREGEFLNPDGRPPAKGQARNRAGSYRPGGLKPKDRLLMPARVALALQADGWWLRDEIVWSKPNPMPSSVRDRTTPAHEMVYLLTRSARYYFDQTAIAEPAAGHQSPSALSFERETKEADVPGQTVHQHRKGRTKIPGGWDIAPGSHAGPHRGGPTAATYRESTLPGNVSAATERQRVGINGRWEAAPVVGTRNKRSVWTVATEAYPAAHFATFPRALIEPMILAGCEVGGVVLDPFAGTGTTGLVAQLLGRRSILIDLNAEYAQQMVDRRTAHLDRMLTDPSDQTLAFDL